MVMKAKFLTIERPLLPSPPKNARPYWCLCNTLQFYDKNNNKIWEQKIPEAELLWKPLYTYDGNKYVYWRDEFNSYFSCEVFLDKNFGWQLRMKLSHNYANIWHKKIMNYIRRYHRNHFKKTGD